MSQHDIIVIGASAGGLEPLSTIVDALPANLPACVLIVVHTRADSIGGLPGILGRSSKLPVRFAKDGDSPKVGHIFVARPDFQLIVTPERLRVVHGPRENGFRPAIDPLFRTAARAFGDRVVGIILSGALDDGTHGLNVIKQHGGIAIVQDPEEALISSMPQSAIRHVDVDYVLRAVDIAPLLERLSKEEASGGDAMVRRKEFEPQLTAKSNEIRSLTELYGSPSALTSPECGGALWEIEDGRVVRYQCHTGHQFAPGSLQAEQQNAVDGALWNAVRVLEEHAELKMRMARRAHDSGLINVSAGFEEGARAAHEQAQQIRAVLFSGNSGSGNGMEIGDLSVAAAPRAGARARPEKTKAAKPGQRRAAPKRRR